jgi:hypothetical protein
MGKYISARTPRDIEQIVIWSLVDNGLGGQFVESQGRVTWMDRGTRIDGGPSDRWSVPVPSVKHDDALRVVGAIERLPDEARALVVIHGRTNCQPDWVEEGVGQEVLKRNRRGQVEYHYAREGDRHSAKLEPKKLWEGETPERVRWFRARYGVWWAALEALVAPLNEVLEKFEATPPSSPAEPWVAYGEGTKLADAMAGDSLLRRAVIKRVGPIDLAPETKANVNLQQGGSATR